MPIRWDSRNKRWRFEFDRVIEGRRHRTSKLLPKGWSQAQADAFDRKDAGRLYAVGAGVQPGHYLIETAVAHYLRDKTHLKSHQSVIENLAQIAWAYSGKTFTDLPAVAQLVSDTREGVRDGVTLKPATVKNRLALLKAACRWGWKKHGMGESDPTAKMQMPEVRNKRHVYATRRQMLELARAADRHDVRVLIRTAFYTGMRLGEILRVEVEGGVLHLADTKNGTRRSIPAHPRLSTCLKYLPITSPESTLQRGWQRAHRACGLGHIHLHDLRHSAASEMVNAGVGLYTVGDVRDAVTEIQRLRAELQHARDGLTKGRSRMREDLERHKPLVQAVEWVVEEGYMHVEDLARLRAALDGLRSNTGDEGAARSAGGRLD